MRSSLLTCWWAGYTGCATYFLDLFSYTYKSLSIYPEVSCHTNGSLSITYIGIFSYASISLRGLYIVTFALFHPTAFRSLFICIYRSLCANTGLFSYVVHCTFWIDPLCFVPHNATHCNTLPATHRNRTFWIDARYFVPHTATRCNTLAATHWLQRTWNVPSESTHPTSSRTLCMRQCVWWCVCVCVCAYVGFVWCQFK